jgi:hypothetical protein
MLDLGLIGATLFILNLPVIGAAMVYFLWFRRGHGGSRRTDPFVVSILILSSWFTLIPSYELAYPALTGQVVSIPVDAFYAFTAISIVVLAFAVFVLRAWKFQP